MHVAQTLTALRLDASSRVPLFRQLYEAIKQAILAGQIGPGIQLPPTRELAVMLRISRQTVLNAYTQLMAEGYLAGTVGKGTFVSEHLPIAAPKPTASPHQQQPPRPLRPLSQRGQRFLDTPTKLNIHADRPTAFRIGMPGIDAFPFDTWARLEARRWRRPSYQLGYGDPAGYGPLREMLAAYLRASRGVHCAPEQVIVTSGSQQALFLIANLLLSPDDAAWVELPGYPGTCAALHAVGARIRPVPVDDEGLMIAEGRRLHPDAKLAYVTPSHQYPLGVTMSLKRRLELLAWAAERRMWIVEDEYDSEYRYTGPPIASLQSLDQAGCVLYVGTLSKVLFPGLRLGYLVVPPALAEAFARGKAAIDRHTAIVPQIVLADFIAEGHFMRHIKRMRDIYAERRAALLEAFDACLADELTLGPADAGFHIATALKRGLDDQAVARAALDKGVEVRALTPFYDAMETAEKRTPPSGLLLGFAAATPAEMRRAAPILQDLLRTF
ncbi:MAG TPA: PLP-dependent aminotransferase family protein [Paucimonas sp.]|nr:PLP-dependent aminotransferase family protein [Paucimonas sp.]